MATQVRKRVRHGLWEILTARWHDGTGNPDGTMAWEILLARWHGAVCEACPFAGAALGLVGTNGMNGVAEDEMRSAAAKANTKTDQVNEVVGRPM